MKLNSPAYISDAVLLREFYLVGSNCGHGSQKCCVATKQLKDAKDSYEDYKDEVKFMEAIRAKGDALEIPIEGLYD